ncbi:MAG: hypothetical protein WAM56_00515 [Acidobacteriaceae bacterium]
MMRKWAVVGLVLLLGGMVTVASAKKKKDPQASKLFCQARYAYVATVDGDVLSPDVLPEDREAAGELQDQLQTWKRYIVVYRPSEADLQFVVRTGRLASRQGQGSVAAGEPYPGGRVTLGHNPGAGTQNPPDAQNSGAAGGYPMGPAVGGAAEVGPPDDLLQVYASGSGTDAHTLLWEHTQHDGLQGSQPLFQHLRDAVETTCKDEQKDKNGH